MEQINIHEAKTHLSALVEKAAKGKPFVIAKAGKPMVTVIPYAQTQPAKQRIGFMRGQIKVPEDFDRLGAAEIIKMFGENE